MARTLPKTFEKVGFMGSRPQEAVFRTMNLIFFLMALFFAVVYFVVASTDEIANSGNHIKDDLTTYLVVISTLSAILLIMEFYFSLSTGMKAIRLVSVFVLFVFIAMSIPKCQDLGSNINTNDGGDTLVYTFSSLTLGFAGIAALINGLEVVKNSGY